MLPADLAAARIAATQDRVLTTAQLHEAGLTRHAIGHRIKHRALQRLWQGVYLLGPDRPSPLSLARAALLTVGNTGFISHAWAAYLWRLRPLPELPIGVTITSGSHRGRKEVKVHRTVLTDPRDFTTRLGLAVTSPLRTLLDIAPRLGTYDLEAALAEAMVLKLFTEKQLHAARHPNARRVRAVIEQGPGPTRSGYERLLRRILRQANLPQATTNHRIGKYEVDFYWPEAQLIVEVSPYSTHGHAIAFHKDARKAAELTAMGYRVMPITERQLKGEPLVVAAAIAAALAQSPYVTAGELARRTSASIPLAGSGREK